jgi:AbiU2
VTLLCRPMSRAAQRSFVPPDAERAFQMLPEIAKEVWDKRQERTHGTAKDVLLAVNEAQKHLASVSPILTSLQRRRNQALAHLDQDTAKDPVGLADRAKLTFEDLGKVFEVSGAILNDFSMLWENTFADVTLLDHDDYTGALSRIANAKHAEADRYEKDSCDDDDNKRPGRHKGSPSCDTQRDTANPDFPCRRVQ